MNIYMDKLPSSCEYCPCNDDYYRCGLSGDLFDEHDIDTGRMKNCKLKKLDDVRENIRGEWISKIVECSRENYDQVFCCSVCGVSNDWRRTNFCPHCGADMRREMEKHFKKDKVL